MNKYTVEHRYFKLDKVHLYGIRLFGRHKKNYASFFAIERKSGSDVGELFWLNGPGFYSIIPDHVGGIYKDTKARVLYSDVLPANLVLIYRYLRHVLTIEEIGPVDKFDMSMTRIKLTLKEPK